MNRPAWPDTLPDGSMTGEEAMALAERLQVAIANRSRGVAHQMVRDDDRALVQDYMEGVAAAHWDRDHARSPGDAERAGDHVGRYSRALRRIAVRYLGDGWERPSEPGPRREMIELAKRSPEPGPSIVERFLAAREEALKHSADECEPGHCPANPVRDPQAARPDLPVVHWKVGE